MKIAFTGDHGRKNLPILRDLAKEYGEKGLKILAFPCNQFGGQEPGTPDEIMATGSKFGAGPEKLIYFTKGDVNGSNARDVFVYLKEKLPWSDGTSNVLWNFGKFVIDHKGIPRERFGSKTEAMSLCAYPAHVSLLMDSLSIATF